jgi:hypothetical protein
VKPFIPWLTVLAVVIALNALRLRPLAAAVAIAWLVYCVWTWVRPRKPDRAAPDRHPPA